MLFIRTLVALLGTLVFVSVASSAAPDPNGALTATLANGLRVVIVRNALAPVVSTDVTYLVGSRDDPPDVPGMAHAQEHMMFRGTKNLATAQLGTIATALGGAFNASTSDSLTQFQFTVPAADFDAVLRIESDRMRDVLDSESQWQTERGAIEQEVLHDESSPGGDFFADAQAIAFKGSPYEHQGVGTVAAFNRLTGPRLHEFYEKWYAPNNAVFTVAGNLDPEATLAEIRAYFESIPRRKIPVRAPVRFHPLERTVISRPTSLVYALAAVGFRMPGIDSPDFLPSFVLQSVLDSQRGALRQLGDSGQALEGEWVSLPYFPEGQLAFATAALAPGSDPNAMARRLEAMIEADARHGVPRELFEATKRRLIIDQEESRNSIEALASDWATTIALDREPSIEREQQLIGAVTYEQVNAVAARYLNVNHAIVGALTPSAHASQREAPAPPSQGAPEKPLDTQSVTALPPWGDELLKRTAVPESSVAPIRSTLPNGITLIVQPETISNAVFVYGTIRNVPSLQEPSGQEGVTSVLDGIFDYGSQTKDRLAFQRAQDDIDSSVQSGTGFGLQATPESFETSLDSSHTIALIQSSQKLLPPGDPELRQPSLESVNGLTLDDVERYYAKIARPDLTTIVVIGNITPDRARSVIETAFAPWHASGAPPSLDLPPIPINEPGDVKLTLPAFGQDNVTLEQIVAITRSAPQYYPLLLGNAILGGGSVGPEQSRLFRDLRQNTGLVYSIDSSLSASATRAKFAVEYACLPQNEPRITARIGEEIDRLGKEPVGDFELSLTKSSVVRKTTIDAASVSSIGGDLLENASEGYPLDQRLVDARALIATNATAIRDAFAAYIHPTDFVRVIEGP